MQTKIHFKKHVVAAFTSFSILFLFLALTQELYLPIGKNLSDYTSDGIKNLYTFAYYLKYDKGFSFTGLFYPFTEQVVYMDAQPFWVWVIKCFESIFHFHVENPVLYIHLILFFNMLLCGFFIFLILFHFCEDYLFTVFGTFIIVLMSPQIFRFSAHYALGNMGIIPMFWWGYICLSSHKKIIPHLLFLMALLGVGYIHPYLLLMLVFLFLSFEGIHAIVSKKIPYLKISTVFASLILFQVSMKMTDSITDRPTKVWGAKAFACNLYDVLLPLSGVVKEFFIQLFPKIPQGTTEGHGYISIFGVFVLLLLIYKFFRSLNKYPWKAPLVAGSINHWVLAAIPVLLFAFFIPFRWNLDWLINAVAPLKQFRGTGRFIAEFYYVYLVFVFVYLKKMLDANKNIMSAVIFSGALITSYDIYNNSRYMVNEFKRNGKADAYHSFKIKSERFFSKIKNMQDYQCILPYPPSTEGTEVMWLDTDNSIKANYFWLSYFYHLPLATVHSSRASFSKNMSVLQLSGYYTTPKPILEQLDKSKKCLVMVDNAHLNENIPLLRNAVFIDSFERISILSLDLNRLANPTKNNFNVDWVDTASYSLLANNHFDSAPKGKLFLKDKKIGTDVITVHVSDDKKNKKVRVLFWYTPKLNDNSSIPVLSAYSVKEQTETFIHDWREKHTSTYNYNNGWFCVDYLLEVDSETNTLRCKISADDILVDNVTVYLQK